MFTDNDDMGDEGEAREADELGRDLGTHRLQLAQAALRLAERKDAGLSVGLLGWTGALVVLGFIARSSGKDVWSAVMFVAAAALFGAAWWLREPIRKAKRRIADRDRRESTR